MAARVTILRFHLANFLLHFSHAVSPAHGCDFHVTPQPIWNNRVYTAITIFSPPFPDFFFLGTYHPPLSDEGNNGNEGWKWGAWLPQHPTQHNKPCYAVAYSDFVWNGQIISINMSTIMYKCCILDLVGGITAAISRFTCIARFREDCLPVYKRTGIYP